MRKTYGVENAVTGVELPPTLSATLEGSTGSQSGANLNFKKRIRESGFGPIFRTGVNLLSDFVSWHS